MRIHFRSTLPCVLRLGGAIAGYCGEADKFADIEEESLLAEFLPANGNFLPLSFVIDETFFSAPPACCDVYRYDGGADIVAARFAPRDTSLRPLTQGRAGGMLATVLDGAQVQAAIESGGKLELVPLPRASRYEIGAERVGGAHFLRLSAVDEDGQLLCLFSDDLHCVLRERVQEAAFGEVLRTETKLCDLARHTVRRTFAAEENRLQEQAREVLPDPDFSADALHETLLPFAFFQELLAGGDPAPYLSPALSEQIPKLREYLGDFCAVTPPKEIFYLRNGTRNAAGLVYARGENLFDVKFFEAKTEQGKIANLVPVP